jgi:hypothetical protein
MTLLACRCVLLPDPPAIAEHRIRQVQVQLVWADMTEGGWLHAPQAAQSVGAGPLDWLTAVHSAPGCVMLAQGTRL